jgi:hypothetical protein
MDKTPDFASISYIPQSRCPIKASGKHMPAVREKSHDIYFRMGKVLNLTTANYVPQLRLE